MAQVDTDRTGTLKLTLTVNSGGGVAGLAAVVALRRGETSNSYLDFGDSTFKTAGFITRETTMVEVGGGHYSLNFDLSTISGSLPAATIQLVAEYRVSGALAGVSNDYIRLTEDTAVADVQAALTAQGYTTTRADELSEILDHLKNRLEWDFVSTPARLNLYDRAGVAIIHHWEMDTDGGEKVSTQFGVHTKRGVPT